MFEGIKEKTLKVKGSPIFRSLAAMNKPGTSILIRYIPD
jgi:hypothetical protein